MRRNILVSRRLFTNVTIVLLGLPFLCFAADQDVQQKKLLRKLEEIVMPYDFREAAIEDCARFLNAESKQLDAEKEGVNVVLSNSVPQNCKVTISSSKASLGEVIKRITESAGLKFRVEPTK